ncbi:hypothetical protein Dsin_022954 [Dipteronia sinensis]|uniref:Uncharacterized protein n=1 Tax=Dipteronia sinensis TaxID=43782 RepID=A0AAE0A3G0_9ROSI|nr:hypothetical protein Dsin_022944 [Dipteronia sinensis]KAK3199539.1 hypothetical protein Dsin_022954 [Dipteronia sinensis]
MEKSSNSMNNNNSMSRRRAVFSNNNNNERMLLSSSGVSGDHHDHQDPEKEESGWTMYFDDFFNEYKYNHDGDQNTSSMISIGDHHHLESSIISDAASSAAKKFAHHDQQQQVKGFPLDKTCYRSSSFKKRKTKSVLLDEDLRDTATSPANSPKVYDLMNQFDRKQQQKNIIDMSKQEKGSTSRNVQIDEFRSGFGSINDDDNNGRDNDTSELKKKGLCLVPLSMIVNYLD